MKAARFILPAAVFALSFLAARGLRSSGSEPSMAETAQPAKATKVHREQTAYDAIRAALRKGDQKAAHRLLGELCARDPAAFFELVAKFPALPGIEDLLRDAAARLPWDPPVTSELLNRLTTGAWREIAWESHGAAQVGSMSDEVFFEGMEKAHTELHLAGLLSWMQNAAEKRPAEFMAFMNRYGGTGAREEFFEMAVKHHPQMADELFASIPDGSPGANYDRAYVLQARARCLPTMENLKASLEAAGSRGTTGGFAALFTSQAYGNAEPAERDRIAAYIAEQPALARNRMLAGPLFDNGRPLPEEEFIRLVALAPSSELQRNALEHWMKSRPDLASSDGGWMDRLPTEKLRAHAREKLATPPVE